MTARPLETAQDVLAETRLAARRSRRTVLFVGAAVVLLFFLSDTMALRRFSALALGVRLAWAAQIAIAGWLLPRVSEEAAARLLDLTAIVSGGCFCLLVAIVGGAQTPMFAWILAFPVVIAVAVQDHPRATLGGAAACLLGGVLIQRAEGVALPTILAWAVESAGLSALAFYSSLSFARMQQREQKMASSRLEALERAARYEAERKLRVRLEEAVRARDEFLSIASHELRTPLTALGLSLQGVQRTLAGQPPALVAGLVPRVQQVQRQLERMGKLVDNLLDSTRIASGLTLKLEEADLAVLAQEAVSRFREQAASIGVTLQLTSRGAALGRWDRTRLEQVLGNLLSNALKYGGGQPVSLRVEGTASGARLEVSDQGIGIAPDDQERIFGRFERAAAVRSYGGLGLGLWICQGIVEAHGGTIRVSSEPGKGATFTVDLPREPARSEPPLQAGSAPQAPAEALRQQREPSRPGDA